jgi:hypothetical protein
MRNADAPGVGGFVIGIKIVCGAHVFKVSLSWRRLLTKTSENQATLCLRHLIYQRTIPRQFDDRIKPLIERAGVDFLMFPRVRDLNEAYFQEADSHWREDGVNAAVSVVTAYIRDKKILESAPK